MIHRSISHFSTILVVFLTIISCNRSEKCLPNLDYYTQELAGGKFNIAIVEFKEGKWINISEETEVWGGRFSYKITVDKNAQVLSINGYPMNTGIKQLIEKEFDNFADEYLYSKEYPHIFFEIQTFNLPLESSKDKLTELICKIHNIVYSIKKEKISVGFDQKLVDNLLFERYVIYEYKQLYKNP